jgi:hypothetical protein
MLEDVNNAYIDSASLYEVLAALHYRKVERWPLWTLKRATEVTCTLINDNRLLVAPWLYSDVSFIGLFDRMMRALTSILYYPKLDNRYSKIARNRVKRWAGHYYPKIRDAFEKVRQDKSFSNYMDWNIAIGWLEHSAMYQGLFEEDFIPEFSKVLNCSENDLHGIWEKSCNLTQVKQWSEKRPDTDDFKLAADAYVLSVLLRGRYYDHIAEQTDMQIMHHPVREFVLSQKKAGAIFKPTNTEEYLTSIILSSALAEQKMENRLSLWAENVINARKARIQGCIDLSQKDSDSVARDTAINYSKLIDLRGYSKLTASSFDVLSSLVIDGLVCVVLCPWIGIPPEAGIPVGPLIAAAYKYKTQKGIGDRVAHLVTTRSGRLHDMAIAVPGRIRGIWK